MGCSLGKRYTVIVTTGKAKGAGTNASIKITLIDTDGNVTEEYSLDKCLNNDFEYGDKDSYTVKIPGNFGKFT